MTNKFRRVTQPHSILSALTQGRIDNWLSIGKALQTLSLCMGVVLVFCYLTEIRFFPSGLTLADSTIYIFVSISLSFMYLLVIISANLFGTMFLWRSRDKTKLPKLEHLAYSTIGLLTTVVLAALIYSYLIDAKQSSLFVFLELAAGLVAYVLVGYFSAAAMYNPDPAIRDINKRDSNQSTVRGKVVLISSVSGLVLLTIIFGDLILDLVFSAQGVKSSKASVALNAEAYKFVTESATLASIPTIPCSKDLYTESIIDDVNILWHGIGDRSLVQLVDPIDDSRRLTLELKRDSLQLLRQTGSRDVKIAQNSDRCLMLSSSRFFALGNSNSVAEKDSDFQLMMRRVRRLTGENWQLKRLVVQGSADRNAYSKMSRNNNYELSFARAVHTRDEIFSMLGLKSGDPTVAVEVEGNSAIAPIALCQGLVEKTGLVECLSANRYAKAVLFLKRVS